MRPIRTTTWTSLLLGGMALLAGCADGGKGRLAPIDDATVRVNETLRIRLRVLEADEDRYRFDYAAPDELTALATTVNVTSFGDEGLFTWTPLPSHVGRWTFVFKLIDPGRNVIDEKNVTITVEPAADTAPVFVSPGSGGTFDLSRDPCVRFLAAVRDDDSRRVTIRNRRPLPAGATLEQTGDKEARFQWCPTPEQVNTSERWTIALEADDGANPPVPKDYIVVLRAAMKPGCPGEAPRITIEEPAEGARVEAPHGWAVTVTVTDDMGVRDAPVLYYTTERPSGEPDLTTFETAFFYALGDGRFRTRIPPQGDPGTETSFYFVVSATDNDDTSGTACDHRTDTPLRSFTGVRTMGESTTAECAPCEASGECLSGHCVVTEAGRRCLPGCDADPCAAGTCGEAVSTEGAVVRACGDVAALCGTGTGGSCRDDAREDDDSIDEATSWPDETERLDDGAICAGDDDYFGFLLFEGDRLEVAIEFRDEDGDLDLELLDELGSVISRSAGVSDREEVRTCVGPGGDGAYYARVFGYDGAENTYAITATVTPDAPDCCVDDPREEGMGDDVRENASSLAVDELVEGRICPGDEDWFRFTVDAPSQVMLLLSFTHADGDLDLQLYAADGTVVASSLSLTDDEYIDEALEPGVYYVRISGWRDASNSYELLLGMTVSV